MRIDYDDLLRERVTPAGNLPLYWCNNVLFSFSSVPMTRDIVKDYLNGMVHWMEIHYTEMRDYKPVIELNDEHYGSQSIKIRVIDTSGSRLHTEVVKWLKNKKD